MSSRTALKEDRASFYEEHHRWPPEVSRSIAAYLREAAPAAPAAAFLGCATGVNDALPFARASAAGARILASDVDPDYLARLEETVRAEGLKHVEVRHVDVPRDLGGLGTFDLAALFFVIHRIPEWRRAAKELPRIVAPGGRFYASEFAGPDGVSYRSNENGGDARDPVARLVRRYFELLPAGFSPPLKSTRIRPFLEALGPDLVPDGHRDFAWPQSLTVGEMHRKIEIGAHAPYVALRAPREVLDRLREEFGGEWSRRCRLTETIRVHRFRRV